MEVDHDVRSAASPTSALSGMGLRQAAILSAIMVLALGATIALVGSVGTSSRRVPSHTAVVVVDNAGQLLRAWDTAQVHGAALVDATRDFGYLPVDERAIPRVPGWPVQSADLPSVWRDSVTPTNVVWVAAKTGIARSVLYVLPATDLQERVRTGREQGFPGIAADGGSIIANDEGYLRTIDDSVGRVPAAAVLNVDASYFVDGTPEELLSQLGTSIGAYRLITINRAVDATGLPASARVGADKMAAVLRERAAR